MLRLALKGSFKVSCDLGKLDVPRIGSDPAGCYLTAPGNRGSGLLFLVLALSHGVPLEKTFVP